MCVRGRIDAERVHGSECMCIRTTVHMLPTHVLPAIHCTANSCTAGMCTGHSRHALYSKRLQCRQQGDQSVKYSITFSIGIGWPYSWSLSRGAPLKVKYDVRPTILAHAAGSREVIRSQALLDYDRGGMMWTKQQDDVPVAPNAAKGWQWCIAARYKNLKWLGSSSTVYR